MSKRIISKHGHVYKKIVCNKCGAEFYMNVFDMEARYPTGYYAPCPCCGNLHTESSSDIDYAKEHCNEELLTYMEVSDKDYIARLKKVYRYICNDLDDSDTGTAESFAYRLCKNYIEDEFPEIKEKK